MMALIEQYPARSILPRPRRIDHHQSVIGDDDVCLATRPFGPLDKASTIVRAARIDAFAPTIRKRSGASAPEQARQPARQVATDHVSVLGVGRPAPDQLRKYCSAPAERSLQCVLKVEHAQIILAP